MIFFIIDFRNVCDHIVMVCLFKRNNNKNNPDGFKQFENPIGNSTNRFALNNHENETLATMLKQYAMDNTINGFFHARCFIHLISFNGRHICLCMMLTIYCCSIIYHFQSARTALNGDGTRMEHLFGIDIDNKTDILAMQSILLRK